MTKRRRKSRKPGSGDAFMRSAWRFTSAITRRGSSRCSGNRSCACEKRLPKWAGVRMSRPSVSRMFTGNPARTFCRKVAGSCLRKYSRNANAATVMSTSFTVAPGIAFLTSCTSSRGIGAEVWKLFARPGWCGSGTLSRFWGSPGNWSATIGPQQARSMPQMDCQRGTDLRSPRRRGILMGAPSSVSSIDMSTSTKASPSATA
mmetsp:Transcript_76511/g.214650  ORF Transcript_76511/g.214650 Transcript_76511/m.214650 type:complete len:203 (-) Transcript_76511:287-895(-)